MNKIGKLTLGLGVGAVMVLGLAPTTANAKVKAKILSTTPISRTTYHARRGNIYSSAKLTKVRYHMTKYRYTTWHATKRATVKKHGKKAKLTYIKAGSKKGWIYSKYLKKGKAPVNKAKVMANDLSGAKRISLAASSSFQSRVGIAEDYFDLAGALSGRFASYPWDDLAQKKMDKAALLKIYDLLHKRLPGTATQKADLKAMATTVRNAPVVEDSAAPSTTQVKVFAQAFTNLIGKMQ